MNELYNPEKLKHITEVFNATIYSLRDGNYGRISELAGKTALRIGNKEILVAPGQEKIPAVAMTNFFLHEFEEAGIIKYLPVLSLHADKFLTSSQPQRQADLIRTISVADQFPLNGFAHRFLQAYSQALGPQQLWLEDNQLPPVDFDPRSNTPQEIIAQLIGQPYVLTDVGFLDWQKAIADYSHFSKSPHEQSVLENLNHNQTHFISVRQHFVPMLHQTALSYLGNDYLTKFSPDQRAETTAMALLGISLT
jgi:hypothetical protein